MALEWSAVLQRLNGLPGFSATAQHVALFKDLYEQAQKEVERLTSECARLKTENERLQQETTGKVTFEEIEGLLWKRSSSGAFDSKPRCPNCPDHPVMGEFPPAAHLHWVCSRCNGVFDYVRPPS